MKGDRQQTRTLEADAGPSRIVFEKPKRKLHLLSFRDLPQMGKCDLNFSLASKVGAQYSVLGNFTLGCIGEIESKFKNRRRPNLDEVIAANEAQAHLDNFDLGSVTDLLFSERLYINISALQKTLDHLQSVDTMNILFHRSCLHVLEEDHCCNEKEKAIHNHTLTFDPHPEITVFKAICLSAMRNNWKSLTVLDLDNADMASKTWSALGRCLQGGCPVIKELRYTRNPLSGLQAEAEKTLYKLLHGPWFNLHNVEAIKIKALICPDEAFLLVRTSMSRKRCDITCETFLSLEIKSEIEKFQIADERIQIVNKQIQIVENQIQKRSVKEKSDRLFNYIEVLMEGNKCELHETNATLGCKLAEIQLFDLPLKPGSHSSRGVRILMGEVLGSGSASCIKLWSDMKQWNSGENKEAKAFIDTLKLPRCGNALEICFPSQNKNQTN